jgi:hypothetical protein
MEGFIMKKKLSFILSLITAFNLAVLTVAFPASAAKSAPSIDDYELWKGKTDKEVLEIIDKEITRWKDYVKYNKETDEICAYRIGINDNVQYHREVALLNIFISAEDSGRLAKWEYIKEGMKKSGVSRSELVAEGNVISGKFAVEKENAEIKKVTDRVSPYTDKFIKDLINPIDFKTSWDVHEKHVDEVLKNVETEKEAVDFANEQLKFLKSLKDNVKEYDIQGEIKRMEDFIRNPKEFRTNG